MPNLQKIIEEKLAEFDEAPVSATEKLVREDIKRLTQNAEEIKKLKEQIEIQ